MSQSNPPIYFKPKPLFIFKELALMVSFINVKLSYGETKWPKGTVPKKKRSS